MFTFKWLFSYRYSTQPHRNVYESNDENNESQSLQDAASMNDNTLLTEPDEPDEFNPGFNFNSDGIYIYLCIYACFYMYIYVLIYMYIYLYIYIHTYVNIYIVYIYIQINI
jgi:hypothetical protein